MQRRVAGIAELDDRLFLRRRAGAGGLDEHSAADTSKLSLGERLPAARFEPIPLGALERFLEFARRISTVVRRSDGRLIGECLLGNEIALAKLNPIDARLARRLVDQPLDEIRDVRPAGTAVGGGRR